MTWSHSAPSATSFFAASSGEAATCSTVAKSPRVEYVPDTSHWVMEERPEVVNRLLLEFLA